VNAFNIAAGFTRNNANLHRMQGLILVDVALFPFTVATPCGAYWRERCTPASLRSINNRSFRCMIDCEGS
jgi:hypothetical protein